MFLPLLIVPLCTLAAVLVWLRLAAPPNFFGLPPWANRVILLLWLVFVLVVLAGALLGYWRWHTWSREEALLVLQDTYWRETRREQRRQYLWLAWARRRGKYTRTKKEG
jgi:hypothetical protein